MQRKRIFRFTVSLLLILSILGTHGGVLPAVEGNILKAESASQETLAQNELTIYRKDTLQLRLLRASNKISWTSKKPSVVSISSNGKIMGMSAGTTTITGNINGNKCIYQVIVKSCATKHPVCTNTPATTDTPVITDTPIYTNTPMVTDEPVYTDIPVATENPVYTDTPVVTDEPVYTNTPATTKPVYTSTPATTKPIYTSTPTTTKPIYTSTPATAKPVYTNTPATTKPVYTQTPVQTGPTESEVYQSIIKMKEKYPEGMTWTNKDYYRWKGGIYSGGYGCVAFAFLLSDAAFGDLPARKHTDFSNIKVGDIIRINNDTHSVIVLEVDSNKVVVAEGNYNSSIHWGRTFDRKNIEKIGNYILTRYPKN